MILAAELLKHANDLVKNMVHPASIDSKGFRLLKCSRRSKCVSRRGSFPQVTRQGGSDERRTYFHVLENHRQPI